MRPIRRRVPAAVLIAALACTHCGDSKDYEDRVFTAESAGSSGGKPARDAGVSDTEMPRMRPVGGSDSTAPVPCVPAVSSDALHPRSSVMSAAVAESAPTFFTRDLFNLFRSHCGGCHVDNMLGGLQVTAASFPEKITSKALMRIRSDDPSFFMPPTGIPYSKRDSGDPIVEFSKLLEAWLAAGSPADVFYPPSSGEQAASASYTLSYDVAMQMTNLGSCVPDKSMVGSETEHMTTLDEMFEKATELPQKLEDTDLTTFDSAALAKEGVIAFAPAYTLWADNAKKIRLVRVPRGTSIEFDKDAQTFKLPPNTRFYKTFLKKVIDEKGNETYRKIETRLILSRPDEVMPDGSRQAQSLFGTYAWNESETSAELVQDPLRNGKPFRDRLITYVINEKVAEDVLRTGPPDLQTALQEAGATRTYAIPGGERCKHCHMGSSDANFILGFIPLQINRRPMGEGGVIEPAARDELNQLQRFIDYGLISGMTSPDDVLPLEKAEGDRKPRNDNELTAQGYMLGNCAHCHNPHGFPSVIAPELRDVLNFFPSKDGGIFQFPLDKFSPRIFRGPERDVPIPYITPSLYDRVKGPEDVKQIVYDVADELTGLPETKPVLAPWRSLIYRNTDTPFSYADDSAIFPHMPLDTASYDCRTRQIFGSWMTSIPARWKLEDDELLTAIDEVSTDTDPQPYVEVTSDDPEYRRYERLAKSRVKDFQNGLRYKDCPDPTLDVVDPAVTSGTLIVPKPTFEEVKNADGEVVGHLSLPVPERPHWAVTDLTDPPGPWNPRRPDWKDVLVDHVPQEDPEEQAAIDLIRDSDIRVTGQDALHSLATDDVPFGMWLVKDGCDFSSKKKVADLSPRPAWADVVSAPEDAPVYEISYGAQVFTAICSNCHGPLADSTGRLAATIADMTGGQTRVANLRDGILGPVSDPGSNRQRIFTIENNLGLTADDYATRYMLWMGLGGTQRVIPRAALAVVGSTSVLGERRTGISGFTATSANMLTAASFLCTQVLPAGALAFDPATGQTDHTNKSLRSALITRNGDVDMWKRLCSFNNPPPVRMVSAKIDSGQITRFEIVHISNATTLKVDYSLFTRASYPADQPVGDQTGHVTMGIATDNSDPWCIHRPEIASNAALIESYWTEPGPAGLGRALPVPYCPETQLTRLDDAAVNRWSTRGAMNAGLSVFLYLDALAHGDKQRPIPYDHCEDLK